MRKYLDRSRKLPLHGRPIVPDWDVLMYVGRRAVDQGTASSVPYLEQVMWDGTFPDAVQSKPATFDPQLLEQWLTIDETRACDTLREQWGMLRAPDSIEEALAMINSADCLQSGLVAHRLTAPHQTWNEPDGEWAVGHCRDCTRPLLWSFPSDGTVTTWPFYEYMALSA